MVDTQYFTKNMTIGAHLVECAGGLPAESDLEF